MKLFNCKFQQFGIFLLLVSGLEYAFWEISRSLTYFEF